MIILGIDPGIAIVGYGVIFYDGRTPLLVEYSSEGCVFACGIRNGAVDYLEFFVE